MLLQLLLHGHSAIFCNLIGGRDLGCLDVVVVCLTPGLHLLVNLCDVEESIEVLWVEVKGHFVMTESIIMLTVIVQGAGEVEVALWAFGVQFDCQPVRVDGLLILLGHVVSIS